MLSFFRKIEFIMQNVLESVVLTAAFEWRHAKRHFENQNSLNERQLA